MSKLRRDMYKGARILGDIEAIKKGDILGRLARRRVGRLTNRFLRRR